MVSEGRDADPSALATCAGRDSRHVGNCRTVNVSDGTTAADAASLSVAPVCDRRRISRATRDSGGTGALGNGASERGRNDLSERGTSAPGRTRTRDDSTHGTGGVFPHRVGHGALRAARRDSLPGTWLGRELRRVLLPGNYRRRPHQARAALRAIPERGTTGS